ncbi:MAG: response regulator [Rhodocyclaceae bacterium]|jgi:CheY-like chemotaxis protein|nr:response regulator [Rhodocyclaceae bacterium]
MFMQEGAHSEAPEPDIFRRGVDAAAEERVLLLVDDEPNILTALKRLLRRDGYTMLTASSGEAGLEVLASHPVDVILSDQRMPGMSGVEFLRQAKIMRPDTVRLVLSGYTELHSITSAINEGAIFKFLTKPWDDAQLRSIIAEAFQFKKLANENVRLTEALRLANRQLEQLLDEQRLRSERDRQTVQVLHEVLQLLPWPLLGVDDDGMIAVANEAAEALLGDGDALIGRMAAEVLPALLAAWLDSPQADDVCLDLHGTRHRVKLIPTGQQSSGRGRLLVLTPEDRS